MCCTRYLFFLLFSSLSLGASTFLLAEENSQSGQGTVYYNDVETNPFFEKHERKTITPYLMPSDHHVKPALDQIFCFDRATYNHASLIRNGFLIKFDQPRSHIIVAQHPSLPGYLVKLYLDSELQRRKNKPGWLWFSKRARSARAIARIIQEKNIQHFVVPKKWIYPLPVHPYPGDQKGYSRKNEILVVEDMQLVSLKESRKAWKTVITRKHLEELYAIISIAGGRPYRPDNLAYTRNGTFAFIDTEHPNVPPQYRSFEKYLSPKMARIWKKIVRSHSSKKDHLGKKRHKKK